MGAALHQLVEQRGLARVAGPHQQHHTAARPAQQALEHHCEGRVEAAVSGGGNNRVARRLAASVF